MAAESQETELEVSDGAPYWAKLNAQAIPSKTQLHPALFKALGNGSGRLLDLGCGDGRLTADLAKSFPDYQILGIDVNEAAIALARERVASLDTSLAKRLLFEPGDATARVDAESSSFQVVLLQLVLSVVGGLEQRRKLLGQIRALLAHGGQLLLSASGASEDINAEYAELYKRDEPKTGEKYTYFSRSNDGTILYPTHHFVEEELRGLLCEQGFDVQTCLKEREASSRRPDQAAWFFYVVASVAPAQGEKRAADDDSEPDAKRRRRNAIAPGSDAFSAAVCVGLSAMQPFCSDGQLEPAVPKPPTDHC